MLVVLAGCGAPEVHLPVPAGPYAPSHLVVEGPLDVLGDTDTCAECHPAEAAAWSRSAHAHASFDNPWYRHSVEALRDEVGTAASRHCGGCHDPVLLALGRMDAPVDPADPAARAGVTCLMCHGASDARPDGNASLRVDTRDLHLPFDRSEPEIARHRARMLPDLLAEGRACGACHRGFLGADTGNAHFLVGMDDQGGWKGSAWAGSDASVLAPFEPERATCVDCHVPDHGFPGAQTALAAATGALPAVQDRLRGAVDVLVGAFWVDGRPVAPEDARGPIEAVDVVVWNTGTGHRFPGGTLDAQDTWLEVVVSAPDGAPVGASGTTPGDPDAARFGALVVDASGTPELLHRTARIVTAAVDRTVLPGQARATRYVLPEPTPIGTVAVRLLHRRHRPAFAEAACRATLPSTLDGCAPQPVTEIDSDHVTPDASPSFERAWAHALALTGELQERLDDARPSADRAASLAPDARARAATDWLVARIEGRQGRLADALVAAGAAERRMGPHPAIDRARADALLQVWSFPDAALALDRVVEAAPGDTSAWRDLARARGSSGDTAGALAAAARGLALQPRDADLLRTQALALEDQGDPRATEALEAWLVHRPPDEAADLRLRCDRADPRCARDRDPVPEVLLR